MHLKTQNTLNITNLCLLQKKNGQSYHRFNSLRAHYHDHPRRRHFPCNEEGVVEDFNFWLNRLSITLTDFQTNFSSSLRSAWARLASMSLLSCLHHFQKDFLQMPLVLNHRTSKPLTYDTRFVGVVMKRKNGLVNGNSSHGNPDDTWLVHIEHMIGGACGSTEMPR